MRLSILSSILLSLLALAEPISAARKPSNSVLLSKVGSLTLYKGKKTSHRRVPAIPQLRCVGGNARKYFEVDVMRCRNMGSDYDEDNVQWTCTASLPEEFKLGSTDVICEGYDSPDDPYVLKGSCAVEYQLMLTEKGEEKFGSGRGVFDDFNRGVNWGGILFAIIFISVLGWILYSAFKAWREQPRQRRQPRGGRRAGGSGGWGGGGDDPYDDPPPPYPGTGPGSGSGSGKRWSSRNSPLPGQQQGWRPGFWSGALGGAAAGYLAGNRGNRQQQQQNNGGWFGGSGNGMNYGTSGPSRSGSSRSNSNSSSGSVSSARYESTGFGSTSRR